ncbi:MAG: septum formation protein Maf [Paludibacteraceae bacterium]|nr:septum formation protein Maf [Paludibacteraceae bacterium]
MNIILGSQSPRRRELLTGLDIPHTEVSIDADESYPAYLMGGDIPKYISRAKAEAYTRTHTLGDDDLLITSDTIVWLDGHVLGKPRDEQDARQMLRSLGGKTHQVYTAVTFARNQKSDVLVETEVDCCDVTFDELSDADIDYYVSRYRPLDKAGAYGIQEWIGYIAVSRINGSFFTVMGFPTHLVHRYLSTLNSAK